MAGHGTAMPTAPAGVRAAALGVAPPLEDEGAARMIELLALARRRTRSGVPTDGCRRDRAARRDL